MLFFKGLTQLVKTKKVEIEKPNVKYGILDRITFPEREIGSKAFVFELPQDSVPKFSDKAKVYTVYRSNKSFLALEIEKEMAKKMGFVKEAIQISNEVYEFDNDYNQKLKINIMDGSFQIIYPYQNDQLLLAETNSPDKEKSVSLIKDFLERSERWRDDFDTSQAKITFLKYSGVNLSEVSGRSEANFTRIDLPRKMIDDKYKIVSINPNKSPVSALLSSSTTRGRDIVEMDYKYTEIQRESFATYPIIDTNKAIAKLKAGNYWPANDVSSENVIIRRISLAYFEPATLTNFMQPIFVFEGDGGFVAYVEAVTDEFTK